MAQKDWLGLGDKQACNISYKQQNGKRNEILLVAGSDG